jgi:hypothetical protein
MPVERYFGTGFLVEIDGLKYLFTAKHVVKDFLENRKKDAPFLAAVNLASGKKVVQGLDDLPKRHRVGWVFDDAADLAATPFPTAPEYRIRTVPLSFFVSDSQLLELQEVFFVSFQPGLEEKDRIRPIFRRGAVALIAPGEVYLDAFVFPGNSGSPVFVQSTPASFASHGTLLGGNPLGCKLVGIVQGYLPYRDVAISQQTRRPRVVFEENSGLAHIVTTDQVRAFIASDVFTQQHRRVLNELRPR